ncbi:hypothetical protein GCM10027442_36050 [Emticicia fontis]
MHDTPKIAHIKTSINESGEFSFNLDHLDKELITITINDSTRNKTFYNQFLYLQKGYQLTLSEDNNHSVAINGIGAEDNHLKGIETFYNIGMVKADSLPDRKYKVIQNLYTRDKVVLDSISKIYQLSANLVETLNYHLKYAKLASFYEQYGNIRLDRMAEIYRNRLKWENILEQLQNEVAMSDEKALVSPTYHKYLQTFLDRKYEDIIRNSNNKPEEFYKEWFNGNTVEGKAAMRKDFSNQLKQKIIEKYFTGKVKEQMYALLFDTMTERQMFANAESILNDFKRQFPESEFIQYFENPFKEAIIRSNNKLTENMVFLNDIKTWDNILAKFKGKTVLIDMWGTWCAPCRQEINEHAAALKQHFKDKNVTFLYIANFDRNVEKWKEVIAYYNLEGNHILASRDFTMQIMEKINGANSYPTYAIIDKNGKVELSKTGNPLDRNVLIQQIEEILKR